MHIPHAKFLDLLTYKAEAVGIQVMITEESYTSQASFLDLDVLPSYDPTQGADQEDKPQFSGRRDGRWYRVKGRAPIHCRCQRQLQHRQKSIPDSLWPRDRGHRSSAQTACRLNYRAVADLS